MRTVSTLSDILKTAYSEYTIRHLVGQETYDWWHSEEYNELVEAARALSPGKSIFDKRTRAYKFFKRNEPRLKTKWRTKNQ